MTYGLSNLRWREFQSFPRHTNVRILLAKHPTVAEPVVASSTANPPLDIPRNQFGQ